MKASLSRNIENIFTDLVFPKTKPITTEHFNAEFEALDLQDEHYILGDFDINLIFKMKYILDK